MVTDVRLPQWLDNLIFDQLGAKYQRSNADMTVIDWDKNDVLNYLGTYFPRSYAESYCIFNHFFKNRLSQFNDRNSLSILDFGCGTGGEIVGLVSILELLYPNVTNVNILGVDGNLHALRLLEKTIKEYKNRSRFVIAIQVAPIKIGNFCDLSYLNNIIKGQYDLIISFKAICEFVTKDLFKGANPYSHIVKTYLPFLTKVGVIALVDVTSYNSVFNEWLPTLIDKGLSSTECVILDKNIGFNQIFRITHSRTKDYADISKVCWRILTNKN